MLFLCELPLLLLLLPARTLLIAGLSALYAAATLALAIRGRVRVDRRDALTFDRPVWTAALVLVLGLSFYMRWSSSAEVNALLPRLSLPVAPVVGVATALIAAPALVSVNVLLRLIGRLLARPPRAVPGAGGRRAALDALLPVALAIVAVTVCSRSSPLYPFNDWDDTNTIFTVGKSMLSGLAPYRDLYEQKGPLLYMLNALAALVSYDTFLGLYIVECVAAACFLTLADRTLRRLGHPRRYVALALLAVAVYASGAFAKGGSAEEFCLPLLAVALWVSARRWPEVGLPSAGESLLIGATAACVLWIKYSMLGFYLGWAVVPTVLALRGRAYGPLLRMFGCVALGVALASLPVLGYFAAKGALGDLFQVYFYNNIFLYGGSVPFFSSLGIGLYRLGNYTALVYILALLGLVWLSLGRARSAWVHALAAFVGMLLTVFGGGRHYRYYSLAFAVFAVYGLGFLGEALRRLPVGRPSALSRPGLAAGLSLAICLAASLLLSPNIPAMGRERTSLPQYQVSAEIARSGVESPTLLNFGSLDNGFYTTCRLVPPFRYFCGLNIPLEDQRDYQMDYVRRGLPDFIVTKDLPIDWPLYELVGSYDAADDDVAFLLYRRNGVPAPEEDPAPITSQRRAENVYCRRPL